MTTGGYSMFDIPKPKQYLIHIHPDPNELGSVYQPDIGLVCNSAEFIKKAVNNSKEHQNKSPTKERANYQAWQKPLTTPGNVKMEVVIKTSIKYPT